MEKKKLPLNFGKEKMGEKHPPIPQQPNSSDCGIFLLHYVELIFKVPLFKRNFLEPVLKTKFYSGKPELSSFAHAANSGKNTEAIFVSGVDVMITIFSDFRNSSAKKLAFFSKTNVLI
jgi:Ulp1 family protease